MGLGGKGLTLVMVATELSDLQPFTTAITLNVPADLTTMEFADEPLLQTLPKVAEEVKITESPLQNVVLLEAEMVGVAGFAFTVTTVANELSEEHPLADANTLKEPEALTTMEFADEPLLQVFPAVA